MADYKTDSFIVCWDLEAIASTSFSGSSLAGGSVSINLKGFGQTDADAPSRWDCIIFHDVYAPYMMDSPKSQYKEKCLT